MKSHGQLFYVTKWRLKNQLGQKQNQLGQKYSHNWFFHLH